MTGKRRLGPKSEAAHSDSATNLTLALTLEQTSDTPGRIEVVAGPLSVGLRLIPMTGERQVIRRRQNARDYVEEKATPKELQCRRDLSPDGWVVHCCGLARIVVLDVAAVGWNDSGAKRMGIRRIGPGRGPRPDRPRFACLLLGEAVR